MLLGAALARGLLEAPWPGGAVRWVRTNHRGAPVGMTSGPALAVATAVTASPAGLVAGLLAGACGWYDDVAGARPSERGDKGLRGHLTALRRGRVSAGVLKVVGIGTAGVAAAALQPGRRRPLDLLVRGAVVAGSANLVNLLDLRPGRALKVGLIASVALRQPGVAGATAALLPADLGERQMLGDTGANALGAVLGVGFLVDRSRRQTLVALALLVAATMASEVVSFSSVIDRTGPLRALDRWGRRR